jgi:hypothetical protein
MIAAKTLRKMAAISLHFTSMQMQDRQITAG